MEALFTGPLEHRHLRHLLALADACVVPSVFPEAFGMVAAEAAAAGCPPLVARHSGLAEVAAGLEEHYPEGARHLAAFDDGRCADLRRRLAELLALPHPDRERVRAAAREAVVERWSWAGRQQASSPALHPRPLRALPGSITLPPSWATQQRVPTDQLLREARERFEAGTDFTVAVEEEFALLEPESLDLVNRFEDVMAAAAGTPSSAPSRAS